jgi:hypothetical protein
LWQNHYCQAIVVETKGVGILFSKAEAEALKARIGSQTPYIETVITEHRKGEPDAWYSLRVIYSEGNAEYIFANNGYWFKSKDMKSSEVVVRYKFQPDLCLLIAYWSAAAQINYALDLYKKEFDKDVAAADHGDDEFRMALAQYKASSRVGKPKIELAEAAKRNAVLTYRLLEKSVGDKNLSGRTRKTLKTFAQQIFESTLLLPS